MTLGDVSRRSAVSGASGVQPPKDTSGDQKNGQEGVQPQETPSEVYSTVAAIAAEYGPDVAIETAAQSLDAFCFGIASGAGDILRDAWRLCVQEILQMGPAAAASSGAENELAYYSGGR